MRVPTPEPLVALIKDIVNQDRRERQNAGFRLGTRGLAQRIALQLGLNIHTVLKIKERKRHKHVRGGRKLPTSTDLAAEKLERIRQRRIREGLIAKPWKPIRPNQYANHVSYKKRLRKLGN
jgi:hypothetical protein